MTHADMGPRTNHNPIIPPDRRPGWLTYPPAMIELVRSARMPLIPWHFVTAWSALQRYQRFQSHLRRHLIPFALRQDREDLACFEMGKADQVFIIHDNTDPGWEDEGYFADFADWLRAVEAESAEWEQDA
jgi:hypothetical protein